MTKGIIVAAGYGTRVGKRPDESKELDHYEGRPLIEFSLNLCAQHGIIPHVVTRKEKLDLIAYCVTKNIMVQVLEAPGAEWAATALLSVPYWAEHNVLLLPDTTFENTEVVWDMLKDLKLGCGASFGIHDVEDQSAWSTINNYMVTEKPSVKGPGTAWGTIAFTKNHGALLLEALTVKNVPHRLYDSSFHPLKGFKDLTRSSTIGI